MDLNMLKKRLTKYIDPKIRLFIIAISIYAGVLPGTLFFGILMFAILRVSATTVSRFD